MAARCLSACGPCAHVCALCQESYDRYYREAEDKIVRDAVRALESRGYIVTKPEVKCSTP